jgi:hypothetical protein
MRQAATVYNSWGVPAVQRGDHWAPASRVNRAADTIGRTGNGNVFAGHDGNVYRNQGGSWQKYDNGGFAAGRRLEPGGLSSSTLDQLNRDFAARRDGNQRTSDLGSSRLTPGARQALVDGLDRFTQ